MNVQEYNEENRICLMAATIYAAGVHGPGHPFTFTHSGAVEAALAIEAIASKELRARREAE